MGDIAGEASDRLHLLLLIDLVLERALLRGLERVDDRGLPVALLLVLDGGDEKAGIALAGAGERGVDRGDLALPFRRLADGGFERAAVALGDDGEDRPIAGGFAYEHGIEQARKSRIGVRDAALFVDGRDRHRRVLEETHEAHFGGALRINRAVAGAVEHERAGRAGRAVGAEGDLVEEPCRHGAAAARLEVDVENLGLHVARHRRQRGEQRRALARHDVVELETGGADLREIVVEPIGERGVEIDDIAVGLGRKEASRGVVEIVDGVLQLLRHVLVPLELARHVGERPDRHAGFAFAFAQRTHADTQPPLSCALVRADSHVLLAAAPLARRLEQAVDGFRNTGIAHEHAFHRPYILRPGGLEQIEIGRVGVHDAAVRVGHQDAFVGMIDQGLEQRARGLATRRAQNAGREREQQEHAERGQHREQREDVGLGPGAADQQQRARGTDEHERDEQHETDTAAAAARPAPIDRRAGSVLGRLLLRHDPRGIGIVRLVLSAPAGESPQGARSIGPRVPAAMSPVVPMSLIGSIGRREARRTSRRGASCHEDGPRRCANFPAGRFAHAKG